MSDTWTRRIRATPRLRRLSTIGALVIGLGLANTHWLGFIAGGVLVSLPAVTPRRGLLTGLVFGILGAVWFIGSTALGGTLSAVLSTGLPAVLAIATPVLLGTVGGLGRTVY